MVGRRIMHFKPATRMVARPVPLNVGLALFIIRRFGCITLVGLMGGICVNQLVMVGFRPILFPMDPADCRVPCFIATVDLLLIQITVVSFLLTHTHTLDDPRINTERRKVTTQPRHTLSKLLARGDKDKI